MDPAALRALQELLDDAVSCPRLSNWDEGFLVNMRGRLARFGSDVRVSEKQAAVLKTIEAKVYAHG